MGEVPLPPPPNPNLPPQFQPPARRPDYQILEQLLGAEYEVTRLQLEDGLVPEVVDALLVAKAGALSEHQKFAIDQHLMRGGKVIVLISHYEIRPERGGLAAVAVSSPLNEMLESWGVRVDRGLLMDPQNAAFPVPSTPAALPALTIRFSGNGLFLFDDLFPVITVISSF